MTGKQIEIIEPQLRAVADEIRQIETELELRNAKVKELQACA